MCKLKLSPFLFSSPPGSHQPSPCPTTRFLGLTVPSAAFLECYYVHLMQLEEFRNVLERTGSIRFIQGGQKNFPESTEIMFRLHFAVNDRSYLQIFVRKKSIEIPFIFCVWPNQIWFCSFWWWWLVGYLAGIISSIACL